AGKIVPGNSTKPRTGMMMSASGGRLLAVPAPEPVSASAARASCLSVVTQRAPVGGSKDFLETYDEATVDGGAAHVAVAPRRQRQAPLEPPLRQLQAMDHRLAQRRRERAHATDREHPVLDRNLDRVDGDAGQRDNDQDLPLGLQYICGRL